jgi:ribonuclease D
VNAPEIGPSEAPRPEARWVDNDAALAEVVSILLDEPSYGLDTEFLSEHTYWPRLCLVQLSWSRGIALVDPFACDVRALADVLHAPATMVTHAGASDLPILDRAIGARPAGLFDTQLAAGFVGLGSPSLGSLVSVLLGVSLDKSEQLADWSTRPMKDSLKRYAAADVRHLLPLTLELQHRLTELGRERWAATECEILRTSAPKVNDPDTAWWRVKGASSMRGEKAKVAQALAGWRERRAQANDTPTRQVLSDFAIVAAANRPPRNVDDLFALRGVNRVGGGTAKEIISVVEQAREMPNESLRRPPKFDDVPDLDAAVSLLVAWVAELASSERIDRQLLATRDDIKAMVHGRPSRLDDGWRAHLAGEGLHRLLEGNAVIRLADGGRRLRME